MKNKSKYIKEYERLNEAISENISRDEENAREYLIQEGLDPEEIEREWEKRIGQLAKKLESGKTAKDDFSEKLINKNSQDQENNRVFALNELKEVDELEVEYGVNSNNRGREEKKTREKPKIQKNKRKPKKGK